MDKDLYDLKPSEAAKIRSTPTDLNDALDALDADHKFLLAGNVFTDDVVENWIGYKRENEVEALRMRPHPYEFCMYFDI